jgi:hypothetical protein
MAGVVAVGAITLGLALTAVPAVADETDTPTTTVSGNTITETGGTVTVGDRVFGPEDGVEVTTESFEVEPGGDAVGRWYETPTDPAARANWGASYAYTNEIAQLLYRGYGYAAANVFESKRIVGVCFWWTRGGSRLSPDTCSNAWSTGSAWRPGLEVGRDQWDTLDPNAPPTVFNIRTTRISPNVY